MAYLLQYSIWHIVLSDDQDCQAGDVVEAFDEDFFLNSWLLPFCYYNLGRKLYYGNYNIKA